MASETVHASSYPNSKLHYYPGKGRRGRRSSLERLPEMPLDVVFEILCHVTPQDLLYLGRSSKTLRALIFSKRYSFLWRAARQQVEGLPPKAVFLSEPKYANLMFDHYCLNCLKPNVKSVTWIFLARYCNGCKITMTTENRIRPDEYTPHTYSQPLPYILTRPCKYGGRYRGPMVARFHIPDFTKFRAALKEAVNAEQKLQIINDRRELTSEIEQFGIECQQWIDDTKTNRLRELAVIKERRYKAVVDRLTTLGWAQDIAYMPRNLRNHPLVKQPKDLTDRAWAKISPQILVVMEGIRSKRLLASHTVVLHKRFQTLKKLTSDYRRAGGFKDVGGFNDATLASFPEVRAVIDVLSDTELTWGSLHRQLGPQIPGFITSWRTQMETQLSGYVSLRVLVPKDVLPLDLAIAVFKCTACRKCLWFPDVLDHDCPCPTLAGQPLRTINPTSEETYAHVAQAALGYPRSSDCYSFQDCSKSVIRMLGKDPERTTSADMDELDAKLICWGLGCKTQQVMTWRTAISHCDHYWLLGQLEGSVKDANAEVGRIQAYAFRCLRCRPSREWDSQADVISHLRDFHQKSIICGEDFGVGYNFLENDFKIPLQGREMALNLTFEDHLALMELPFAQQCAYLYNRRN